MAALADLRPVVENEASGLATIRPELKKTHLILAQRARWAIGNIKRESTAASVHAYDTTEHSGDFTILHRQQRR
jgi:hypothetical protein